MNINLAKLKHERITRNISLAEMAKAIHTTECVMEKKESGELPIFVDELRTFLNVMNIPKTEAIYFFD